SGLSVLAQLLRLDLLGRPEMIGEPMGGRKAQAAEAAAAEEASNLVTLPWTKGPPSQQAAGGLPGLQSRLADWTGWAPANVPGAPTPAPVAAPVEDEQDLPLSVILDEHGSHASSILAGREIG